MLSMRGRARAPPAPVLLALALALCLPASVDAYASMVPCDRSITSGSMMGPPIVRSTSQQVKLARGGSPIACGGTLTPSEAGLTLSKSTTGSQFCKAPSVFAPAMRTAGPSRMMNRCAVIEVEMSAGTGAFGIISGSCNMQRTTRCESALHGALMHAHAKSCRNGVLEGDRAVWCRN